jgi:hypothetical protein
VSHPSNSALRAELGTTLKALQASLSDLAHHLRTETRDAWLWQRSAPNADALSPTPLELSREHTLERITDAIAAIKYADDQDAHESRIAPGVVVTNKEGLTLATEANRHKRALAKVLRNMQDRTETGVIDIRTGERGERPLREVALEAYFFRRLHHWQATRELVILRRKDSPPSPPDFISFSWATSRDVRRTDRETLLDQLRKARLDITAATAIEHDLRLLEQLPKHEPLALVRPGHTVPKANIAWPSIAGREPERQIRPAVLPLLMIGDRLPARFRKLPPAPTPKHFRLARADTEIDPEPLLQTHPVHRYAAHILPRKRAEHAARKKPA